MMCPEEKDSGSIRPLRVAPETALRSLISQGGVAIAASEQRIRIMGSPGSGKTTIARAISRASNLPLLSLDTIRHAIDPSLPPDQKHDERRAGLETFLNQNSEWIIEGNQLDWARDTVEQANQGIVISRPLPIRTWRTFQRWREERKIRARATFRSHLGLQFYTALWDSKWLPPLIEICDGYGLSWDYCRSEREVAKVLSRFPGALDHYREEIGEGTRSYRAVPGIGFGAELARLSQESLHYAHCIDDLCGVLTRI